MDGLAKRFVIVVLLITATVRMAFAQDFLPTLSDNYMGINQALLQPAAITDSHFERDFSMVGFNCDIFNNAMRFKSEWLLNPLGVLMYKGWWDQNTYLDEANGKEKNFFMSQSIIGPSFMVSVGEKTGIGFIYHLRSITNTDGLTEPLFNSIYTEYDDSRYWNKWYLDEKMRSVQHVFGDYSILYARELMYNGPHYLKGGVSVKLLHGISAAYVQTDQLYFYYDGSEPTSVDPVSWNSPSVQGGLSGNWGHYDEEGNYDYAINYQVTAKPSVGLDIGFVYEYRPRYKQYFYNVDGRRYLVRKDRNKYLFKIGVSLLDIGRLKYTKEYNSYNLAASFTPDYLQRYQNGINTVPENTNWLDARQASFSFLEYVNFVDTLYRRSLTNKGVELSPDDPGYFKVRLPSAFSAQLDFKVYRWFYVNTIAFIPLNQQWNVEPNSHYINSFSITPRYEKKWLTVSLPVQYTQFGKVNVGLGVRTAFVYLGVTNLVSAIFNDASSLNVYIGAKFPVFKGKPRADVDNDILAF
ncbi:MAG TPA: DUF5723 family protein [Bacteroidales bacterium]|nr:DUF5723 family protein [Bacteroidales bacterium]